MEKIYNLIGLARASKNLNIGDKVYEKIKSARLLLVSDQASANTKKKINDKANFYNIKIIEIDHVAFNHAIGMFDVKVAAITSSGFAKKILELMKGKVV